MPDNKTIKTDFQKLLPVYIVIFIGFMGYSLMITIFTPMIMYAHNGMVSAASTVGHRTIILGILLTLYPLGQFLGSPVLGSLSDRFGRRPILLISLAVSVVCYFFIAFSLTLQSLWLLMASSFIGGLSEANVAIAQSAIADKSTSENRNRLFGYIYLSASSAYIVGPLFGGRLADPSVVSWFNYSTPFYVVLSILVCSFIFTYLRFEETRDENLAVVKGYFESFTSLLSVFKPSVIRPIFFINFLIYLAIFGFFRSYPMYLVDKYNFSVSTLSVYIAWVAVPVVIANLWLTGYLSKFYTPVKMTIVTSILTGVFIYLITVPNDFFYLWITLFPPALALSLCLPACATMLSLMVKPEEQGSVMGNNQSLQVAAEAMSGFGAGLLAAIFINLPLIVISVVAVVAGLLLLALTRKKIH